MTSAKDVETPITAIFQEFSIYSIKRRGVY